MSTSPFPWSEGESFVFDADEKIICREHHTENLNWKDDRALIAAIPAMISALEECAAPFSTSPGSISQCQAEVNKEFERRLNIASRGLAVLQKVKKT